MNSDQSTKPKLNERTIDELLTYDTEALYALPQDVIDRYLEKAILDQEEILKKVPKKKGPSITDLGSGGTVTSRKEAARIRNESIALPPEIMKLAAETQALLAAASAQLGTGKDNNNKK